MAAEQEGLLTRARDLAGAGKLREALGLYRDLCYSEPYNPDLWLERADVARRADLIPEAVETLFHVADLYARSGMVEAAEIAQRVLAIDPHHTGARQFVDMFAPRPAVPAPRNDVSSGVPESQVFDSLPEVVPSFLAPEPVSISGVISAPAEPHGAGVHAAADRWSGSDDAVPVHIPASPSMWESMSIPLPALDLPSGPMRAVLDGSRSRRRRLRTEPPDTVTRQVIDRLLESLSSPLIEELDADALEQFLTAATMIRRSRHEVVFRQGDAGSSLYLILRGSVDIERRDETSGKIRRLATLREGAFFGEMALLSGVARTATVRAARDVMLLRVSRRAMRELSDDNPSVLKLLTRFFRARLVGTLMATSPLFRPLSADERRGLVSRFRLRELAPDKVVLPRGRISDGLYLVLVGTLEAVADNGDGTTRTLGELTSGDVFGEMSLLDNAPAMATIRTTERTWLLRLPKQYFDELVGKHPEMRQQLHDIALARRARNKQALDVDTPE